MNYLAAKIKKNKHILIIVFLFFVIKIFSLPAYRTVWWDSAVYIGMGKYVYSLGNSGFWEASRPLVWPLILGFFHKTGFGIAAAGRIIEIIFGSLCIFTTYFIGKKSFDESTALIAAIFLALSPTFFFFNGIMLTEIVSTFFSLAALSFFMKDKYFASGIFFGIAFMSRFLQLFALAGLVIIILAYRNKIKIKNILQIASGFVLVVLPFLIFNQIAYGNFLFPFARQLFLSASSGWSNYHGISYYFAGLFRENFLYILSAAGVFLCIKSKDKKKTAMASIFFLMFLFFNSINQKEMRFLIILLPYMYLLAAYPLSVFIKKYAGNFKQIAYSLIIVSLVFSAWFIVDLYSSESQKQNQYQIFQDRLSMQSSGSIWISNPIIAVSSNLKISKLMYYEIFSISKKNELIKDSENAGIILVDSCDLACRPSDYGCESAKAGLIAYFKQNFKTEYSNSISGCSQFIFEK